MTEKRLFVQVACRVSACCLQALLQRENAQKPAGMQECRNDPPLSLEKRKGGKGKREEKKKKEALPCLHILHSCRSCTNA